ncbi:uncharacterized protein si:ch73-109d9.1 isoform X2 [Trichomycterus rosablanca]|uniref:uncharacterized protein si:ch73-109d9.1 isoform X2 n=1 Tax=Trichomycterus rosablanca TaxID=2290929 RepID=UPI002F355D43
MPDALVVAFQSQLSVIMETILKSAMMEISRLVEDSFMEEVARGKQELELLLRRLQFSERKLKERERRGRCADCGRAAGGGERAAERPADALTGEDALCFRLSLREQSEKRAPFNEVWRSTEATDEDSYSPTDTHNRHAVDVHENGKNNNNVLPNVAIMRIQEPRVSPPSKKTDLLQSFRLEDVKVTELASSPGRGTVKPEQEPDPNPESVEIKEEQEMLPVWDFRDDEGPAEADPNRSGSWDHDETQPPQRSPENPPGDPTTTCSTSRQRTFSVVAREILMQFQVWQRASYSRNIEWGPITAKIISALPYLSGREAEVIVRCTKMLHNRRDYLRRRAKDASLDINALQMGHRYFLHLHRENI